MNLLVILTEHDHDVQIDKYDIVKKGLDNGLDINEKGENGENALMTLCKYVRTVTDASRVAKLLFDAGININEQDNRGWTCMHYLYMASESTIKYYPLSLYLLELGVNLNILDNSGLPAISYIKNCNRNAFKNTRSEANEYFYQSLVHNKLDLLQKSDNNSILSLWVKRRMIDENILYYIEDFYLDGGVKELDLYIELKVIQNRDLSEDETQQVDSIVEMIDIDNIHYTLTKRMEQFRRGF